MLIYFARTRVHRKYSHGYCGACSERIGILVYASVEHVFVVDVDVVVVVRSALFMCGGVYGNKYKWLIQFYVRTCDPRSVSVFCMLLCYLHAQCVSILHTA